ncbi:MAG TPA: alkaline phosphatase PhoX, partial [Pyrinomonadaceae bacterium]|nr:alkaline phosphatase PhoX [Pyrinomonadaceae bacterium]
MGKFNRRTFLRHSALAGGFALAVEGMLTRADLFTTGGSRALAAGPGYGPLLPTATLNTGELLLALPEGFQYTVIGRSGVAMSDGQITPGAHDGMATFADGNKIRLVRNHEQGPGAPFTNQPYDTLASGGTTTLVVNPVTRLVEKDFASLSGTIRNCAGGATPWGSWLTCEETTVGRYSTPTQNEPHGYVFEVPASANGVVAPVPLKAMGRFSHEATAIDPATNFVYQTEDAGINSGFYRFLPNKPNVKGKADLAAGGLLQMLAVKNSPKYDTRTNQTAGADLPVVWVDIKNPDPFLENGARTVFAQGYAKGAARFARLEGAWYGDGNIYFDSTSAGNVGQGQIWRFRPTSAGEGILTLLFESPSAEVLNAPDNLCVNPHGGLVLCEDGGGEEFVHILRPNGEIFKFIKNIVPGFESSEFAGST